MPERGIEDFIEIVAQLQQRIARLEAREVNQPGDILMVTTGQIRSGHLWCDGAAYNQSDYPALFAAIGRKYGGTSTTFNVPDMVGRFPLGAGASYPQGTYGGEYEHALSVPELPTHNHGGSSGSTAINVKLPGSLGYTDDLLYTDYAGGGASTIAVPASVGSVSAASNPAYADFHTHTITNEGGGGAHNNMPPYCVVKFMIVAR